MTKWAHNEYGVRTDNNTETYQNRDEAEEMFNELQLNPPYTGNVELVHYGKDTPEDEWEETTIAVAYVNGE